MYIVRHVNHPLFLSDLINLEILGRFSKNPHVSNFMKFRPVGAELLHADGQTDMTTLTVAFRSFVKSA